MSFFVFRSRLLLKVSSFSKPLKMCLVAVHNRKTCVVFFLCEVLLSTILGYWYFLSFNRGYHNTSVLLWTVNEKKKKKNTFVSLCRPASADPTLLRQETRPVGCAWTSAGLSFSSSRAPYSDRSICPPTGHGSKRQATPPPPPPQCVFERRERQHTLSARGKVCSHSSTHKQSCELDARRRARNAARVHICQLATHCYCIYTVLYCSVIHVCHTCCLYDYQTLLTYPQRNDVP